jgi:hypothetical protein
MPSRLSTSPVASVVTTDLAIRHGPVLGDGKLDGVGKVLAVCISRALVSTRCTRSNFEGGLGDSRRGEHGPEGNGESALV